MMNKYLLFFLSFSFLIVQNTGWGQDISLDSQADVDAFDTSITAISGTLNISGDDIMDLSNLSNITTINAYLNISRNATLQSLTGLENITFVGKSLYIDGNDALQNLDALVNITTVGESLMISDNDALQNLDGLANLTSVDEDIVISHNDTLQNLDGLVNISSVGGNLAVAYNAVLQNINGLANITSSVNRYLDISGNDAIQDIDALANITSVGVNLIISGNDALQNLDGLANITSVGGSLGIFDNNNLTNCCGIQQLLLTPDAIGGNIDISNNPSECSSQEEIIETDCTSSVPSLSWSQQVHLFPNPTAAQFVLDIQTAEAIDHQLVLTNVYGQTVSTTHIHQWQTNVEVSDMPSGIYWAQLRTPTNELVAVKKLMIVR